MNVVAYQSELHRSQLELWWKQWDIGAYSLELLSTIGLIIPESACMFIYETNSPLVLFENLVCNKELSAQERDEAIKTLVSTGKEYAKMRGYKQIMLTTNNASIVKRAVEDGCFISPEKFHIIFREV